MIASFVLLIFLMIFSFSDKITNGFFKIASPFQAALWNGGEALSDWTSSTFKDKSLKKQVDLLLEERQLLIGEIIRLREVDRENEQIRQLVDLKMDRDFSLEIASVSGKSILEDAILINKGLADGIEEGMPVITEKRAIVGVVAKTFEDFSRVNLITHEKIVSEAEIQGKGEVGLLKGGRLTLVPKEVELTRGDALITAPLSESFPQGLAIGIVRSVDKADSSPYQEAEIAPLFSLKRLNKVFIILDKKSEL